MKRSYLPVLAVLPLPVLLFPLLLKWLQDPAGPKAVPTAYSLILMLGVGVVAAFGATLAVYLPYHLETRGVVKVINAYAIVLLVLVVLMLLPQVLPEFFAFITRFFDLHLYRPWVMGLFAFYATLRGYTIQVLRYGMPWVGTAPGE